MSDDVHHLVLAVPEIGLGDGVVGGAVAICGELAPPCFFTAWETFMALRVDLACRECAVLACDVADMVEGAKVAIDSTLKADEGTGDALASDPRRGERRAPPLPCAKPSAGWACSRGHGHPGPCAAAQDPDVEVGVRTDFAKALADHVRGCRRCAASVRPDATVPLEVVSACPVGLTLLAQGNALSAKPLDPKPESPTAKAVREELLAVLSKPLTVQSLRRAGRIVSSAIKVLKAIEPGVESYLEPAPRRPGLGSYYPGMMSNPDPDGVDLDDGGSVGVAEGPSFAAYAPPVETFGTNTFREVAAGFVKLLEKKSESDREPDLGELVESLARAKEAGLGDSVVRRLEAAVDARLAAKGKPSRDVEPTSVVVSEHDSPPVATIRECSTGVVGPA